MTRSLKRKTMVKKQERDNCEKFTKKSQVVDDWGDDENSGWDDKVDILNEKDQMMHT
jgi:hypothetical protein